ncbi:GNAT family N-acetyltransferase [Ruegeria sp. SCPT10]|uniref:GNAT family N-acetyltransferase n=1 Tax=Ruegeria sp. SCP10 TaxID=3141377 RepID=UPI00333AA762
MHIPQLRGYGFVIDPMTEADFEPLYAAASDPVIWAGHPARTRHKRDVFGPYFEFLLEKEGAVTIRDIGGRVVGCSKYYEPPEVPGGIAIGYSFLTVDHWGGASNRAVKALMLDFAFQDWDQVWFHIDPSNIRSQKATAKLGARHVDSQSLDLGNGPTMWMRLVLLKDVWNNMG